MIGKWFARSRSSGAATARMQIVSPAPVAQLVPDDAQRFSMACALNDPQARETALLELALHAQHSQWRLKAAEATQNPRTWTHLRAGAKDRDRGVYRLMKARLAAFEQKAEREQGVVEIETMLHALLASSPIDLSRLIEVDRQWTHWKEQGAASEKVSTLRAKITEHLEKERTQQREAQSLREAMIDYQECLSPETFSKEESEARIAAWAAEIEHLDLQVLPVALVKAVKEAYGLVLQAVALAAGQAVQVHQARALLEHMRQLSEASYKDLEVLRQDWKRIGWANEASELHQAFLQECARLRPSEPAIPIPPVTQQDTAEQWTAHLQALEVALAEGQSRIALELDDRSRTYQAEGQVPRDLLQRLRAAQEQVAQLRGWRHFTAATQREALCTAAEALDPIAAEPEVLALEITQLQERWKQLDVQLGGASRALWNRFHAAMDRAYAPVKVFRAQQAQERAEHEKAKQVLLEELEQLAAACNESAVDCKHVAQRRREVVRQWYEIGPKDRRHSKRLEQTKERYLSVIDNALEAARRTEQARREGLIAEVETAMAAAQASERMAAWLQAIDVAKDVQQRWQSQASGMLLKRQTEQALWERLRGVCNEVFRKREEARRHQESLRSDKRAAEMQSMREAQARAEQKNAAEKQAWVQARRDDMARYGEPNQQQQRLALVMDLEIALGLDSPPAFKALRLERQVGLLSSVMKGEASRNPRLLLRELFSLTGCADAAVDERIDRIVEAMIG